jgi:hypothetical protein
MYRQQALALHNTSLALLGLKRYREGVAAVDELVRMPWASVEWANEGSLNPKNVRQAAIEVLAAPRDAGVGFWE